METMDRSTKYPIPKGDLSKLYAKFKNEGDCNIAIVLSPEEQERMDKITATIAKKNILNLLSEYFSKEEAQRHVEQWIAIAFHEESHYYHDKKRFYVIETKNGFLASDRSLLDQQITDYLTSVNATKEAKDALKDAIILECKKCSQQQNSLLASLSVGWSDSSK
jgi:hypothetical protein